MNSSAYLATFLNYVHNNSVITVDPTIVHFVLFLFGNQQFSQFYRSSSQCSYSTTLRQEMALFSSKSSCILLKVYFILKGLEQDVVM